MGEQFVNGLNHGAMISGAMIFPLALIIALRLFFDWKNQGKLNQMQQLQQMAKQLQFSRYPDNAARPSGPQPDPIKKVEVNHGTNPQ